MTERERTIEKLKKVQATLLRLKIELASVKLRGEKHHITSAVEHIDQAFDRMSMAMRPTTVGK
jgi:hypothetical protein